MEKNQGKKSKKEPTNKKENPKNSEQKNLVKTPPKQNVNLEGSIVKIHVRKLDRYMNGDMKTCPGIVTLDLDPEKPVEEKSLNIKVLLNGLETIFISQVESMFTNVDLVDMEEAEKYYWSSY